MASDLTSSNELPTISVVEKTYKNQGLSAKLKKLYLDAATADAYFLFEDTMKSEKVPAHKNLLSIGSDSLYAMFYRGLKREDDVNATDEEVKENGDKTDEINNANTDSNIVKIEDVSIDAFKEFLQFFYCDQVKLTMENIYEVVYLGKKYLVEECINVCERFLNESLADDNVCIIYELSIRFDMFELQHVCEAHISKNANAVFQSECFIECKKSVLSRILRSNALSCAENAVFLACMEWVKAASKQEVVTKDSINDHLGDLFQEIRFGSMTIEEFAKLTTSYGELFTRDEYQEIVQTIVLKDFQPKIFKKDARGIENVLASPKNPVDLFQFNENIGSPSSRPKFSFNLGHGGRAKLIQPMKFNN